MSEFEFDKGDDIKIKLDGDILGGVKKAVCNTQNSFYDISQFLTDTPVDRIAASKYKIELVMNCSGRLGFLQGQSFEQIEIFNSDKSVAYRDCFVDKVTVNIAAKNYVEYTVNITANERREL